MTNKEQLTKLSLRMFKKVKANGSQMSPCMTQEIVDFLNTHGDEHLNEALDTAHAAVFGSNKEARKSKGFGN